MNGSLMVTVNSAANRAILTWSRCEHKVNKQKKNLNCINSQLAIRISKPNFFQTCITRPPIIGPNLRSIGMLVILQPRSKDISTDHGQTDGQTDGQTSRVTT